MRIHVFCPATGTGKKALSMRAASLYADRVTQVITELNCSQYQKRVLLSDILSHYNTSTAVSCP
jgi:hypothetical protein